MNTTARAVAATAAGVMAAAATRDWSQLTRLVAEAHDPRVRATALAALVRGARRAVSAPSWRAAARDRDRRVRLRAAQLAPRLGRAISCTPLLALLDDDDIWVRESAAYAIGEHPRCSRRALDALVERATNDDDPLIREAAVAALGAQGNAATLPAVLAACDDKPAVRRRAVLALAAFEGAEVETRLHAALTDADWQVRQAAEDLLSELA
jgi:HEAT repeat protein